MKKTIFTLVMLVAIGGQVFAQQPWQDTYEDTLCVGMREPTYYYWDTNWFDHEAVRLTQIDSTIEWACGSIATGGRPEYARYCYTDSALRVIGVAGTFRFSRQDWYPSDTRDPWEIFQKEYFKLYEVDSTSDDMVLLAEAQWAPSQPRYLMDGMYNMDPRSRSAYQEPVFEAYFKTPQIVHDSFYVATTMNNNRSIPDLHPCMHVSLVTMELYDMLKYDTLDYGPKPNHFKRKLQYVTPNIDPVYGITDTLWHVLHTLGIHTSTPHEHKSYLCLFPIIDTGWRDLTGHPHQCPTPTGLSLLYINSEVAMLTWDGPAAHQWQLSVTPEGGTPGGGTVYTTTTDMQAVTGLDTARWYTAWVRSLCDNDSISEWSDSVRFYVPSQNSGTIAVEQAADAFTHVMPNPASGSVSVICSYRMSRIDVYSTNGSKVMTIDSPGNSVSADISSLPSGTYLMRVYTTNGVANKRLVVK